MASKKTGTKKQKPQDAAQAAPPPAEATVAAPAAPAADSGAPAATAPGKPVRVWLTEAQVALAKEGAHATGVQFTGKQTLAGDAAQVQALAAWFRARASSASEAPARAAAEGGARRCLQALEPKKPAPAKRATARLPGKVQRTARGAVAAAQASGRTDVVALAQAVERARVQLQEAKQALLTALNTG